MEDYIKTNSDEVLNSKKNDEVDLASLVVTVMRRRWLIIGITAVFLLGSVAYALLKQSHFTATATVIPVGNSSGIGSALSQYSALASSLGVTIPSFSGGSSAPDQEIMAILQSRTMCEQLVKDLDLLPLIFKHPERMKKTDPFPAAVRIFQMKDLEVTEDEKSSVISIKVTLPDKTKAAEVANHAVEVLESILNQKNAFLSKQSTESLEEQINEQGQKVQQLQDQLASFQKNTKIISPEGQVTSAMTIYASLLQQKLSLEVTLSRLQNALSLDNPQVTAAKAQLDAVNQQIDKLEGTTGVGSFSMGNAPEQIVEYQNIAGDLDIAVKIYASLLGAYENAKLQQAQSQVFVQTVDPAIPPQKQSPPSRSEVLVVGTIIGVLVAFLAAFLVNGIANLRDRVRSRLSN